MTHIQLGMRFVDKVQAVSVIEQNKHRNLSSKFISMSISHLVANDPEIPVSNIIQEVQVLYQTGCTYKWAWYTRKFAIERIFDEFPYCRPMISMDGTHLRGPYKGVLLISSTWDANNHLFPLDFAIVDKESCESWNWFLKNL
ncbi:hypothetical protein M9H77_09821 [Catharanthus roseus]|uniref:Uncharacterized protein n=1 Tax=Catharanthus roseus TaxID=4058 RepID=A0ACC0C1Q8_CATRO|nr:hypothetical protein M9H77_09821 [Catharanthus roseus]